MNILLTCAGRRNYLVEYFRAALRGGGQVFAADACIDASALQAADRAFVVPALDHPDYFDHLLSICEQNGVGLLVSLNDLELLPLARQRDRFLRVGTLPVISSPEVVNTCFDKWLTLQFLQKANLPFPPTYLTLAEARDALSRQEIAFPLVVKPRWGTGSIGVEFPADEEELELTYRLVRKKLHRTILARPSAADLERSVLIQAKLEGQEYGLDVVNDLNGQYVTTFIKRKSAMRAGETNQAATTEDYRLQRLGENIGRELRHVGNLDCDVFLTHEKCYLLEMNPRFGGGYPFSHIAGANLPAALIAWASGEVPDARWLRIKSNVKAAKYDNLLVMEEVRDSALDLLQLPPLSVLNSHRGPAPTATQNGAHRIAKLKETNNEFGA